MEKDEEKMFFSLDTTRESCYSYSVGERRLNPLRASLSRKRLRMVEPKDCNDMAVRLMSDRFLLRGLVGDREVIG